MLLTRDGVEASHSGGLITTDCVRQTHDAQPLLQILSAVTAPNVQNGSRPLQLLLSQTILVLLEFLGLDILCRSNVLFFLLRRLGILLVPSLLAVLGLAANRRCM